MLIKGGAILTNPDDRPNQAMVTRKEYNTPVFTEFGRATQLTLGGTKGVAEHSKKNGGPNRKS
ncbi:MAG: hypothetical protein ABSH56_31695 [Bryobacteraceae bacterium]|jgi:hypothetical protein